jgi:hypothetical protein
MMARGFVAAVVVAISALHAAHGKEGLYCIAPSHTERKLYMSPVFETDGPVGSAELAFAAALDQSSFFHYDDVQCPRSDDEVSATDMQRQTVTFNRQAGNTIITLRWKPRS